MTTLPAYEEQSRQLMQLNELTLKENRNWEELDPDIRPYLTLHGPLGGPLLRHPLLYEILPYNVDRINQTIALKRERVKKLIAEGELARAIWYYERPYRLPTFVGWLETGRLAAQSDEAKELLNLLWTDAEYPSQYGYMRLVRLFKLVGYLGEPPPAERLVIYRGCLPKHRRGLSWTLEQERATFFAHRYSQGGGLVYQAEIAAKHVLAMLPDRGEAEVVVNPRALKQLREVET